MVTRDERESMRANINNVDTNALVNVKEIVRAVVQIMEERQQWQYDTRSLPLSSYC